MLSLVTGRPDQTRPLLPPGLRSPLPAKPPCHSETTTRYDVAAVWLQDDKVVEAKIKSPFNHYISISAMVLHTSTTTGQRAEQPASQPIHSDLQYCRTRRRTMLMMMTTVANAPGGWGDRSVQHAQYTAITMIIVHWFAAARETRKCLS